MDWSDDVAYSVHDVEDAVASGRLDLRRLRDAADVDAVLARRRASSTRRPAPATSSPRRSNGCSPAAPSPASYDGSRADLAALKDMTSRLIGRFVVGVEEATRAGTAPGR